MYFEAIASTCVFTSRSKAFWWSAFSPPSLAVTSRSKLSSGNLASTGTSLSTLITASTRSPVRKVCWSRKASGGSESRRRLPSRISPTPPRAFGGRRACSRRARSFARESICEAAPSSLPSRSTMSVAVLPALCWVESRRPSSPSSRRSTFVSSSAKRRSIASATPPRARDVSPPWSPRRRFSHSASAAPPASRKRSVARSVISRRTLVRPSDSTARNERGRLAPPSKARGTASLGRVRGLGVVLAGAFALLLSHLLSALGALRGHALLLLLHVLALHRVVARRLLLSAEQLVPPTHCSLLAGCRHRVSAMATKNARSGEPCGFPDLTERD